ncbi:hypothetical protein KUL106_00740 [Alteromonas sp. KUL106]|nr:hypothetical protein KUL106_00740 [Alteromonas sp. KUL106]
MRKPEMSKRLAALPFSALLKIKDAEIKSKLITSGDINRRVICLRNNICLST